jgi:hypothetical protein
MTAEHTRGDQLRRNTTVEQKANELLAHVDAYRDLSSSLAVDELG